MTQDDSKTIAACAVGCGVGLWFFFKGFREFRESRVVADTPVIPIRSVPMGLVQVRGKAQGSLPVTSPVSHTPCFWYQVVIEQWKSRGGGTHETHTWEHLRTDCDGSKFYLEDATGHIKVNPVNAELDLPQSAQRVVSHASSARVGSQATDEELLRYVTKSGVHSVTSFIGKGIEHIQPLSDPDKEAKRQMLLGMIQSMPGSPDFMQRAVPLMAPMIKRKLEFMGPQANPEHEQARLAALAAFDKYPPGSPEFIQALQSAAAMSGDPQAAKGLQEFFHPGDDLASFGAASGRYRLTESCIIPDGSYDITGTCAENPESADEHDRNLLVKGFNEPTFLISAKSEKQLESSLRWRAAKKVLGGAALAVICLAIILAKLGLLF